MAEELPDTPWDVAQAPPPPPPKEELPETPWATAAKTAPTEAKPTEKPQREMPTVGSALMEGVGAGFREAGEGIKVIRGQTPEAHKEESPAAAPLEWSDIFSPIAKGAPKLAYGVGKSAPTLAGGLAGGMAGAVTPIPGATIAGGAIGAGAGAALQSIAPHFAEELKTSPNDPDGAWSRAVQRTAASGGFAALGWGLFPAKIAEGPIKQIAFQALGLQPAVAVGEQATQNVIQGKPATENLGAAYAHGAVGTAIPMAGHAALGAAFREAQSVKSSRAQDPILSRIGEPEGGSDWSMAGLKQKWNDAYTNIKDSLNPIHEVETKYSPDGKLLNADESPYIQARLTRGSYGKAEHFVEYGTFDPITRRTMGKGLKEIIEPIQDDLEGFRKYAMSKRAIELDGRGIETGINIPEAVTAVAAGRAKFEQPFRETVKYNSDVLEYAVKSGLIGAEDAVKMRDMNKDFVPFYRLMEEQAAQHTPGEAMKVRKPVYGMSGSDRMILDPIESMIKNTYLFISLADRNMAREKLVKFNESLHPDKQFLEKEKPPVRPITVTPEETERALARQGRTVEPDSPDSFAIFRPDAFRPAPDKFVVFQDGKRQVYNADPRLVAGYEGLNNESSNLLTKILSVPAKFLRAGATLSPEFIVRNPVRDQFSALIFSTLGRGYVPIVDAIKGLGSILRDGEGYQNWLKSGGANSAMVSIDRNYVENLVRSMKDPSVMGTVKNIAMRPLELLRGLSELTENATRVGESMRQMKRGSSYSQAGYAAREVTLDFQRIGAKMQAMNSIIAFFNAQLEGVDRAARSIKEQPFGFMAKGVASITLPSLYLWWANKDDPRMKEIPRWEKDIFWIVPTDNWQPISAQDAAKAPKGYVRQNKETGQLEINKGNIWRIPKPFELGVMFGSLPERILDAYYAKNPKVFSEMGQKLMGGDISGAAQHLTQMDPKQFKGIGSTIKGAFTPNFVPQAASPLIEQWANRSLFTDRPLIPHYLEGVMPQFQSNPYTSDTAKMIGNMISKLPGFDKPGSAASPIIVENYIRAWTGGLGLHAVSLADAALRGVGVAPTRVAPTLTNSDKTLIKAFAVRFPEAGANSIQDFYEESDKRMAAKKTAALLQKQGDVQSAQEVTNENVLGAAENLRKAIGTQFKLVRDVYQNPKNNMTPDQKRQFVDMSYLQIIKLAQIGNEMFERTEEAFKKKKEAKP